MNNAGLCECLQEGSQQTALGDRCTKVLTWHNLACSHLQYFQQVVQSCGVESSVLKIITLSRCEL